jgi:hypothetical protein
MTYARLWWSRVHLALFIYLFWWVYCRCELCAYVVKPKAWSHRHACANEQSVKLAWWTQSRRILVFRAILSCPSDQVEPTWKSDTAVATSRQLVGIRHTYYLPNCSGKICSANHLLGGMQKTQYLQLRVYTNCNPNHRSVATKEVV